MPSDRSAEAGDRRNSPSANGSVASAPTEPNHGSDPDRWRRARKVDGGYSLSGAGRRDIRNAPIADVSRGSAKTEDGVIRGFILEKAEGPGQRQAIHGKVGLRASITGEVAADGVLRAGRRTCCPMSPGPKGPFTCLNLGPFGIAWGALGAAEDCY